MISQFDIFSNYAKCLEKYKLYNKSTNNKMRLHNSICNDFFYSQNYN